MTKRSSRKPPTRGARKPAGRTSPRKGSSNSSNRRYLWGAVVGVTVMAAMLAFYFYSPDDSPLSDLLPVFADRGAVSTPSRDIIVDDAIVVQPGNFQAFSFDVDLSQIEEVVVEAQFTVSGGSGNDIRAIILDEQDYGDWVSNNQMSNPLYRTGQITSDAIEVPINVSGRYYFVFDNKFSIISNKAVQATISMVYRSK